MTRGKLRAQGWSCCNIDVSANTVINSFISFILSSIARFLLYPLTTCTSTICYIKCTSSSRIPTNYTSWQRIKWVGWNWSGFTQWKYLIWSFVCFKCIIMKIKYKIKFVTETPRPVVEFERCWVNESRRLLFRQNRVSSVSLLKASSSHCSSGANAGMVGFIRASEA